MPVPDVFTVKFEEFEDKEARFFSWIYHTKSLLIKEEEEQGFCGEKARLANERTLLQYQTCSEF